MKKISMLMIFFFAILLFSFDVQALKSTSSELTGRNVCEKFELALANSNDTITSIACYDEYAKAKEAMNLHESDDAIILEKVSGTVKVIDAKYALVYLGVKSIDVNTYIYSSSSLSGTSAYMNNNSAYGATDAAFIKLNYSNKAIYVRIAGINGWVKNGDYRLIPLSWVKSSSYYFVNGSDFRHYYAKDIETTYTQSFFTIGPKFELIEASKKYYSYDGNYMYDDQKKMIDDYKNGNFDNAKNNENPYYNYYMYLPHRSRTNYTVDDIETYIRNVLGYKGSIYGRKNTSGNSTIFGQADFYLNAEKLYGANALMVLSLSRNESANGRSTIAITKNNIFGHNAVDGSPYSSATGYLDIRSSIYTHGYGYINYGYSEVADSRYRGGHFGNKSGGMNVNYASDPYWGEKATSYYYTFDKSNGLDDYNYYQLAISNNTNVNARTEPNTSSETPYSYKYKNIPVIILEEVKGQTVNGSDIWYKVQSDTNLNTSRTGAIAANSSWPQYNWNSYVYVHSSYFTKINDAKKEDGTYNNPTLVSNEPTYNLSYKTYASGNAYSPIVGLVSEDINYYYSSSLINKRGTILKDSYVTILEEAKSEDDIRYLVIIDYSTYQKGWISGENVKIVKKDLLGYLSNNSSVVNIYDKVNGTDIGDIYTDNYLVILDKVIDGDDIWVKVEYKVNPITYGYIKIGTSMTYTLNNLNKSPVISVSDKVIYLNTTFNPLDGVTGSDEEDGDITSSIVVADNKVQTDALGIYTVTYSLTDSFGEMVSKTINVTVNNYETGKPLFMYHGLIHKSDDIFTISGFLGLKSMNNVSVNHTLVLLDQLTGNEYRFPLNNWKDYPYEMSSLDDTKTYDYSGGWFKSDIDFKDLPSGDYIVVIEAINDKYQTESLFTNIAYAEMSRRAQNGSRGYRIEIDYSSSGSPLIFSVRSNGLLSYDVPLTLEPMYNFFNTMSISDNNLTIRGTSHNFGVDLSVEKAVNRELIFENTKTFMRYVYPLDSITNGDYQVTLAFSDKLDKTRAWYDKVIDLTEIPTGDYSLYIKNTVDGKCYYGELIDIAYTDFSIVNSSKYIFKRNNERRLRVELSVNK